MKKYYFLFLMVVVFDFCFSQTQKETNLTTMPLSIYSYSSLKLKNFNTAYSPIQKSINTKPTYTFITVSSKKIAQHRFLISDGNLINKPSQFIYDDYKSYRDENLLKGFIQKYDITRWRSCNFRQPSLN